jgi:hypothetical protein
MVIGMEWRCIQWDLRAWWANSWDLYTTLYYLIYWGLW